MAELYYKEAIKRNFEFLADYLNTEDIIPKCYEKGVLSLEEKQELECIKNNKGSIAQAKALLTFVLKKKDALSKLFIEFIQEKQSSVAAKVEETRLQIVSGKILPHSNITELSNSLKQKYKEQGWHLVEALPGETFVIDLDNPRYIMPTDFEIKLIDVKHINEDIEQCKQFCPPGEIDQRIENIPPRYITNTSSSIGSIEECIDKVNTQEIKKIVPHIVLCLGNAGTGKSIMTRRYICEWTSGCNSHLARYKVIFLIPLRNIDRENTLMDILGEGRKCMGYLSIEQKKDLHQFLINPQNAHQILFLLDGADEVQIPRDSELYQLITGEIYQGVHILITARPDAESLQRLKPFWPVVKAKLKGTTKEGIYKYIKATLMQKGQVDNDEVENILTKCEAQMFDFNLLYVPLYCALISFIFNEHWAKYASFSNFEIPNTVTKLFNAFLRIILKIWLRKLNRIEESNECTFTRSPLDSDSCVPFDIQRILAAIGKLSYYGLRNETYSFNQHQLHQFLIDAKDLRISGLFCTSEDHGDEVFLRHKMLQEYFSATHLCSAQFQDIEFTQWLDSDHVTGQLENSFGNLLPFICGIGPEFASDIIQKLNNVATISCELSNEAQYCFEANHPTFTSAIAKFIGVGPYCHSCYKYTHIVFEMLCRFTAETQLQFLEDVYGISITNTDNIVTINQSYNKYNKRVTHELSQSSSIYENESLGAEESSASARSSCWPFCCMKLCRQKESNARQESLQLTNIALTGKELKSVNNQGEDIILVDNVVSADINFSNLVFLNELSIYLLLINGYKFPSIEQVHCMFTPIKDLRLWHILFPSVKSLSLGHAYIFVDAYEETENYLMQNRGRDQESNVNNLKNLTLLNGVSHQNNFVRIEDLYLVDSYSIYTLTSKIVLQILGLSELEELHLVSTDITKSLSSITNTEHKLQKLHTFCSSHLLSYRPGADESIHGKTLLQFIESLPKLQRLHMFYKHIDMHVPNMMNFEDELVKNLSNLSDVLLCGVLTTEGVKKLFNTLSELHCLKTLGIGAEELMPHFEDVIGVLNKHKNITSFKVALVFDSTWCDKAHEAKLEQVVAQLVAQDPRISMVTENNFCNCMKEHQNFTSLL